MKKTRQERRLMTLARRLKTSCILDREIGMRMTGNDSYRIERDRRRKRKNRITSS